MSERPPSPTSGSSSFQTYAKGLSSSDISESPESHQELVQWLGIDHLGSSLRRKLLRKTEVIILEVDVMEVLCDFPNLGNRVLRCPEVFGRAVLQHILYHMMQNVAVQDALVQSRIHVRWEGGLPLPVFRSVQEVLGCIKQPCPFPGLPIQFLGVISQISSVQLKTYVRRVRCQACGTEHLIFQETQLSCCEAPFEEDLSSRIEVPYQEVFLRPLPQMIDLSSSNSFQGSLQALLLEDLCSKALLGDSVLVRGHASCLVDLQSTVPPDGKAAAGAYIRVNNLKRVNPLRFVSIREDDTCPTTPWFVGNGLSLEAIARSLCTAGYESVWSSDVCISLLLSLVSISDDAKEQSLGEEGLPAAKHRKSIHVLLAASAFCSVTSRQLRAVALLSPRAVTVDPGNRNFVAKASSADLKTGQISVTAGTLALANDGVCVIDISKGSLRKDAAEQLHQSMEKEFVDTSTRSELAAATRVSVWAFFTANSSKKSFLEDASRCLFQDPSLDVILLSRFDVVLKASAFGGRDLDRRVSADLLQSKEQENTPELTEKLRAHLRRAGLLPSPHTSPEASELLQAYYMVLRRSQSASIDSAHVSLATLNSLMRVASASAKLCLRTQVLEMPDAALAVYLHEKSLEAKFGEALISRTSKVRQRSSSSMSGGSTCLVAPTKVVDLDQELLDFFEDLRLFMTPLALYRPEE